jgi:S1-C subfamily serine protease
VIGYPGGGPESVQPAVIDGAVNAQGRDIYNQSLVTREIWVIQSVVRPGNSGGPLLDKDTGKVVGVVFATSASDPNQAYALTYNEVSSDVQAGEGKHSAIDTSQYPCAA